MSITRTRPVKRSDTCLICVTDHPKTKPAMCCMAGLYDVDSSYYHHFVVKDLVDQAEAVDPVELTARRRQ
jgi:aromatic ring hydroxylase